jgi:glycosyltransferase A (GT-A) superfamily protein (DUF2064 family)
MSFHRHIPRVDAPQRIIHSFTHSFNLFFNVLQIQVDPLLQFPILEQAMVQVSRHRILLGQCGGNTIRVRVLSG